MHLKMNKSNNSPLIECKNVKFYFTKEVILYNVNWIIHQGDFWAVIGPNGGGKSTLAKLIAGLLKPSSGEISTYSPIKIGYVPQNTFLNRHFPITALEVVMMGFLKPKSWGGFLPKEAKAVAYKFLEQVHMESFVNHKIGDLSGGQRQRVLIARALCGEPNLLILDEPTASIDKENQKEIYDLLLKINQEKTIIIISHDISILLGFAKQVLYVNKEAIIHELPKIHTNKKEDEHFCEIEMLMEYQKLTQGAKYE